MAAENSETEEKRAERGTVRSAEEAERFRTREYIKKRIAEYPRMRCAAEETAAGYRGTGCPRSAALMYIFGNPPADAALAASDAAKAGSGERGQYSQPSSPEMRRYAAAAACYTLAALSELKSGKRADALAAKTGLPGLAVTAGMIRAHADLCRAFSDQTSFVLYAGHGKYASVALNRPLADALYAAADPSENCPPGWLKLKSGTAAGGRKAEERIAAAPRTVRKNGYICIPADCVSLVPYCLLSF